MFEANVERSQAFLRIFDKDRGRGQPANDEKELLRRCLVFAVGALDAYLSDLILEIVPEHAPKSTSLKDALAQIAKADPGLVLRVSLAATTQDKHDEFRTALSEWLETKSFQGPEKVVNALGYLGCPISWQDFDESSGVATATELRRITDGRHKIVHRGQKPYIKRALAKEAVTLISNMADLIDSRVCARYR
ncbi:HEPN domain-containing protein [Amycolatopsis arida]|uniref:HEPN domain-containing protein n=1 Tax=Amycolatopsis arida TaxID=587909 RepID=UPI0014170868|nr:HEPN domain-containing protein [Amycolatopsis arida]